MRYNRTFVWTDGKCTVKGMQTAELAGLLYASYEFDGDSISDNGKLQHCLQITKDWKQYASLMLGSGQPAPCSPAVLESCVG